jgi:hypothetical protein
LNSCKWPTVQAIAEGIDAVKYNAYGGAAALQQFKKCRNITAFADVSLFMLDLGRSSENCQQQVLRKQRAEWRAVRGRSGLRELARIGTGWSMLALGS